MFTYDEFTVYYYGVPIVTVAERIKEVTITEGQAKNNSASKLLVKCETYNYPIAMRRCRNMFHDENSSIVFQIFKFRHVGDWYNYFVRLAS